MADHDDKIPDGAVELATIRLIRMPSGDTRFSLIVASPALKRDAAASSFASLYGYVRYLIRDAALRLAEPPSAPVELMPPCNASAGQRREQDEWICACGCGRRWAVGEERPARGA